MKKIFKITGIVLVSMVFHLSCDTDFLNTQPKDKIASSATWSDGALSTAFIYNVYGYLGYAGFEEEALASFTDEAMFTHAGRGIDIWNQGTANPSNLGNMSDTWDWNQMYLAIRQANVAILELTENATFDDEDLKERLIGEAYFLRAYYYHQLLRFYGGVPIIDKPYGLGDDYSIARSSYEACSNFILGDLDQAISLLDGKDETRGRASKMSAMGLKARVLLYAASDLHDGPTASANSSLLSSYSDLELIAYTSGDRTARWNAAKTAAEAVLDVNPGWKMDLTAQVSPEEGKANYVSLAMGGGSNVGETDAAIELLFERTHTALYTVEDGWPLGGIHYGINNGPNGYHNWAGNTPIQQMVDDYEMMDGSRFDWNNPAHAADPYTDRDPRFYASVLYDGAGWKPRPADVVPFDAVNQIQTGYYDDGAGALINGIDTREGVIENWNGSRSHYYTRKFLDPDPGLVDDQSNAQVIPWPFIRTTEMALIYAEACIETGDEDQARLWMNKIRYRAGMPGISDTGNALMDRLINERRVELAYEEHRYHDARRWMIAESTLGRGIKAINIVATLKAGMSPHEPYRHDRTVYDYVYTPVDNTDNEVRTWVDKMYYRPIERDEVNRNELLVNNPGHQTE